MSENDKRMDAQAVALVHIGEMFGRRYRHFKGNIYKVYGIGVHSETAEPMVIYAQENDSKLWIRPLSMFLSEVDHDKYPDVKQKYRFELLDECKDSVT